VPATPVIANSISITLDNLLDFVYSLPKRQRKALFEKIIDEAYRHWSKNHILQYDATDYQVDDQAFYRYRGMTAYDAMACALMKRCDLAPQPEQFSGEYAVIWPDAVQKLIELIGGEKDYYATVALYEEEAMEHYRLHGEG
jgi:hypothetical protein